MAGVERFDPAMTGKIAYEHWHRYAICRDHCQGREVLDVASGEGYGAAFLAENAARVVGLEIDDATVVRARSRYYGIRNLSFETGDCCKLPFDDATFDLVVSMETFEHIVEKQQFIAEVKRVLRQNGLFIVSTPNRVVYREERGQTNPFHMHEVDGLELTALLSPHFAEVELSGQRLYIGSIIGPASQQRLPSNDRHYSTFTGWRDRRGRQQIASAPIDVEHPEYFVAFCSDARVDWPVERHSVYAHEADDLWRETEKTLIWASGLHEGTAIVRRDYAALEAETNAARREVERLTAELGASHEALARSNENMEAHLPLIRSAAQRAGLDFNGQARLEDVVRVLAAVDRAYELAGERQAGLEAREALTRQTADALRELVDQTRRDLSVLRVEEMLAEIARLREDVQQRDADLRAARDEAAASRREVEAASAKVVTDEAREAAFAREQEERQRQLANVAALQDALSIERARATDWAQRHAALTAGGDALRTAVQGLEQSAAAQKLAEVGAGQAEGAVTVGRGNREATFREHLREEHLKRRRLEVKLFEGDGAARRLREGVSRFTQEAQNLRDELGAVRRFENDFIHAELAGVLAARPANGGRREGNLQEGPARIAPRARRAAKAGDAGRDAKDYRRAAEHYDRALRLAPDWSAIWVQYGHALKEQGDHVGSEAAYLRAIALTPEDGDAHRQLGHVRKRSGNLQGALEAYARATELDPWLDDIQWELDQTSAEAERRELSPDDQSQLDAAREARDRDDKKGALDGMSRLVRRAPGSAMLWCEYGCALREEGHRTAAIRAFTKALGLLPWSAAIWRQLGDTLTSLGDKAGARTALRHALALQPASQALQARVESLGEGEERLSLASQPVAEFGHLDLDDHRLGDVGDWPELDPPYWLPQRMRNLLVDRYRGADLPRFISLMGLVDRFANHASDFRPDTDGRHLIEVITRAAIRQDQDEVRASIIIPVHNNLVYTLTCIASVLEDNGTMPFEIIVGDDRSDDETFNVISSIGGCVRIVRHDPQTGFLLNCNATAAFARGEFVVMLNNDTIVLPGWLDTLIGTFDLYPDAGFVGSKLLNGDGSLQEAGGIFWRDGSAWNFGRNAEPGAPEFNYVKDVDYVSGASIALPTRIWTELGGFDPAYSPAYCEDADMAFRVRELGLRTLYQPHSALIHHEGRSHGRDLSSGIKAYQVINQRKLFERWKATLQRDHFPRGEEVFVARDRSRRKPHLLLINHDIPQWDRDAGSRSIYLYLKLFRDRGFQVTLWPSNLQEDREYITRLQDIGIEVIYSSEYAGRFAAWLQERKQWIDYAFVSRSHIAQRYLGALREAGRRIIFYGHDLHFRRTLKEYAITGNTALLARAAEEQILEETVWGDCDVILYPSASERDEVRTLVPASKAVVQIPVTFFPEADLNRTLARLAAPELCETNRLMFVGGFGHPPNVDAMVWFVEQVMPKLRRHGGFVLSIAGSNVPQAIRDLAADDVRVLGRLSDAELDALYAKTAVALLPLRYGAGVKGKLIEALTKGVPIVSTSTGVQGIEDPETIALVADDPHGFAKHVLRATANRREAIARARRGVDYVRRHYSENSAVDALAPHIPELADS